MTKLLKRPSQGILQSKTVVLQPEGKRICCYACTPSKDQLDKKSIAYKTGSSSGLCKRHEFRSLYGLALGLPFSGLNAIDTHISFSNTIRINARFPDKNISLDFNKKKFDELATLYASPESYRKNRSSILFFVLGMPACKIRQNGWNAIVPCPARLQHPSAPPVVNIVVEFPYFPLAFGGCRLPFPSLSLFSPSET